jgi:CBS domain-containing protein
MEWSIILTCINTSSLKGSHDTDVSEYSLDTIESKTMLIKVVIRAINMDGGKTDNMVMLSPGASILEATRVLSARNVGLGIVCGEDGRITGVLSERDIVRGLSDQGSAFLELTVSQIMNSPVSTCTREDDARDVIKAMHDKGYRHMPVVEDGKPVGIVSSRDVLRYLVDKLTPADQERLWSDSVWL